MKIALSPFFTCVFLRSLRDSPQGIRRFFAFRTYDRFSSSLFLPSRSLFLSYRSRFKYFFNKNVKVRIASKIIPFPFTLNFVA